MELNKKEVSERLGVTTRAVERYMSTERPLEHRLVPARYQLGRGGQQPIFDSDAVDEFKARMTEAATAKREAPQGESLALTRQLPPALLQLLTSALAAPASAPPVALEAKIFLTIRECSQLSGLSQKEIKDAVKASRLKARLTRRPPSNVRATLPS